MPKGALNHLKFACDIFSALDYIHSRNVIHHDIKPSNIGRSDENQWTLFDFNIATQLKEEHGFKSFTEGVGTKGWQAPEVVKVDPNIGYDSKADIYSFGLVLRHCCQKEHVSFMC